jgi:4-hydroxymandelate oxidase
VPAISSTGSSTSKPATDMQAGTQLGDVDWLDADGLEAAAAAVLDGASFDYFAGGAGEEITLAENRAAWRRWQFLPRVLQDVSTLDTSVTLLGDEFASPVVIAPMGYQRLAHPDGESATARAAAAAGLLMAVSTYANTSLEEVAAAGRSVADTPRWFQCYVLRDRGLTEQMIRRAGAAGYRAVVVTVDAPVAGDRRRDRRHGYQLPTAGLELANFADTSAPLTAKYSSALDPALTEDVIAWVASVSEVPVVVKGVVRADDALRLAQAGAAAVVVSNHGGRQLDGGVATADALAEVVDSVAGAAQVLVDGGIRSGADVLRALALGADAVLIGRPVLWALALAGEAGVTAFLAAIQHDLRQTMALCGVAKLNDVPRDLLRRRPPD